MYEVFDLLHLDGRSLVDVPLEERKRLLKDRLRPHPLVRYASHVEGDGEAFFAAAREQELEGIVAKLRRSPYEPGRRSKSWLKLKVRREQEVVVVGWLPGQGSHADLGSLILGVRTGDRWAHAGQVGSGLGARTRRELLARMSEIERPDSVLDPAPRLRGARWVEPEIVIRVEFAEWTADDLLRQAAYKGIEPEKDPRERSPRAGGADCPRDGGGGARQSSGADAFRPTPAPTRPTRSPRSRRLRRRGSGSSMDTTSGSRTSRRSSSRRAMASRR